MNSPAVKPQGLSVLGIGAAACAACCAGPILAFLGAIGLFTATGVTLLGAGGLLTIVPAALWWARRRRRQQSCQVPPSQPVPVALSRRS